MIPAKLNLRVALPFLLPMLVASPIAAATMPTTAAIPAMTATGTLPDRAASSEPAAVAPAKVAAASPDRAEVECIAKVIVHEAGDEPARGQLAVAQVIKTRIADGRFGTDACSVVKQHGQFFDVDAYHPAKDDGRWTNAVAIAATVLTTDGDQVAPGALFFHAAYSAMPNRVRVAQIGGHVFYR